MVPRLGSVRVSCRFADEGTHSAAEESGLALYGEKHLAREAGLAQRVDDENGLIVQREDVLHCGEISMGELPLEFIARVSWGGHGVSVDEGVNVISTAKRPLRPSFQSV